MFFQSFIQHHQVCFIAKLLSIIFYLSTLVLYFDRIPLWGNFIITLSVGLLVGLSVMIFVKPRLKHSIEETLKKKHGLENKDEQPQLTKTEGRFETYTGKYEDIQLVR